MYVRDDSVKVKGRGTITGATVKQRGKPPNLKQQNTKTMGIWDNAASAIESGAKAQKPKLGLTGWMEKISPFVPIAGGIISNILGGINERKARLYNSPAQQVKRLNEAGLPKAAASNIGPGGGVTTVQPLGTDQYNDNLSKSIQRSIDRKRLDILAEDLRVRKTDAAKAEGENAWLFEKRPNYLGSINNNQAAMMDLTRSIQESQDALQNNQQFISGIEAEVKEQLKDKGYLTQETINRVDLMFKQIGLISEQTSSLNDQRQAREVLLNTMRKNGMNIMEALAYMMIVKWTSAGN